MLDRLIVSGLPEGGALTCWSLLSVSLLYYGVFAWHCNLAHQLVLRIIVIAPAIVQIVLTLWSFDQTLGITNLFMEYFGFGVVGLVLYGLGSCIAFNQSPRDWQLIRLIGLSVACILTGMTFQFFVVARVAISF